MSDKLTRREFLETLVYSGGGLGAIIIQGFMPKNKPVHPPIMTPEYMSTWQKAVTNPKEAGETLGELWKQKYYTNDWQLYGMINYIASPFKSLPRGGDCEDAALAIAYGLEDNGYHPYILMIWREDPLDVNNHAVFPFRDNDGNWGYVGLTKLDNEWNRIETTPEIVFPSKETSTLDDILEVYNDLHPISPPFIHYTLIDMETVPYDWRMTSHNIELKPENVVEWK